MGRREGGCERGSWAARWVGGSVSSPPVLTTHCRLQFWLEGDDDASQPCSGEARRAGAPGTPLPYESAIACLRSLPLFSVPQQKLALFRDACAEVQVSLSGGRGLLIGIEVVGGVRDRRACVGSACVLATRRPFIRSLSSTFALGVSQLCVTRFHSARVRDDVNSDSLASRRAEDADASEGSGGGRGMVPSWSCPQMVAEAAAEAEWEAVSTRGDSRCGLPGPLVRGTIVTPVQATPADGETADTGSSAGLRSATVASSAVEGVAASFHEAERLALGAEELIPLMAYALVRAGLPALLSELRYVEMFLCCQEAESQLLLGPLGYSLATFNAAVELVRQRERISWEGISPRRSPGQHSPPSQAR